MALHTWRKFRIAPLIRSESAAIPAMPPSPWSRSCLREVEGAVLCTQLTPQQGADDSGWELCRIILEPVVTTDGGATGHELHDTCKLPPKVLYFWTFNQTQAQHQFRFVELVRHRHKKEETSGGLSAKEPETDTYTNIDKLHFFLAYTQRSYI